MTVDLEGRVIRGIDMGSQAFRLKWKDLPGNVQNEAFETIKGLIGLNIDQLPAKLHFHQLVNKSVPSARDANKKVSAWSLHVTADDRYKASFTYEGGTLYFRTCGVHDTVDKKP